MAVEPAPSAGDVPRGHTMSAPQLPAFGAANYRSFGEGGFLVEGTNKVNVFIGRNNSGKSNVLRVVELFRKRRLGRKQNEAFDALRDHHHQEKDKVPEGIVGLPLPQLVGARWGDLPNHEREWLEHGLRGRLLFRWNLFNGKPGSTAYFEQVDLQALAKLNELVTGKKHQEGTGSLQDATDMAEAMSKCAAEVLQVFDRILLVPVFREVEVDRPKDTPEWVFDGRGVIGAFRRMQAHGLGQHQQKKTYLSIVRFVRDLLGVPGLEIHAPAQGEGDDLIVTLPGKPGLELKSMGTGVHHLVILCAALAMYEGLIVCVEEPEVHLHPDLQRRFLQFILGETENTYFITTHSNVFLDARKGLHVYHVSHDGEKTTVAPAWTTDKAREVLSDMGYKSSDLLQCNGIIWVEGPSDRIYVKKWLSFLKLDQELVENSHYSFAFYGGAVLPHFSCDDAAVGDFIQLLRINRNAVVMMDRDGDHEAAVLNEHKGRIIEELGEGSCWVTQGRTVENYLRRGLVEGYLKEVYGEDVPLGLSKDTEVLKAIEDAKKGKRGKVRCADSKVSFARALTERMTEADLDVLDLRDQMKRIAEHIRRWNGMPAPT